ncbi:unnamed protein product [Protopolystoma xenopodis]|uniref:Uncharacterized protein n=1 Tax=Protopolystoma xenopodis TaxID=117903 RepID=A0A448WBA5_9PLAT|nr:unnamed protein product [Protopolystoma xenopodis]
MEDLQVRPGFFGLRRKPPVYGPNPGRGERPTSHFGMESEALKQHHVSYHEYDGYYLKLSKVDLIYANGNL